MCCAFKGSTTLGRYWRLDITIDFENILRYVVILRRSFAIILLDKRIPEQIRFSDVTKGLNILVFQRIYSSAEQGA